MELNRCAIDDEICCNRRKTESRPPKPQLAQSSLSPNVTAHRSLCSGDDKESLRYPYYSIIALHRGIHALAARKQPTEITSAGMDIYRESIAYAILKSAHPIGWGERRSIFQQSGRLSK